MSSCHPTGLESDRTYSGENDPVTVLEQATEQRPDIRRVQRRTLRVLILSQMIGGIGVAIGIAVGALLAKRMGGTAISGFAQSSLVVGAALLAIPVTRLMNRRGRRPGLTAAYLVGAAGAVLVLLAAARGSVWLLFVGLFLFGGGNAANFQARYSAVDLAEPSRRGRQLSWVVWATTVGSVAGPNLALTADESVRRYGAVTYSGPFAFSAAAFLLAGVLVFLLLRPDPLLTARSLASSPSSAAAAAGTPAGSAGTPAGSAGTPAGSAGRRLPAHARVPAKAWPRPCVRCWPRPEPGSGSPRSPWDTWSWSR